MSWLWDETIKVECEFGGTDKPEQWAVANNHKIHVKIGKNEGNFSYFRAVIKRLIPDVPGKIAKRGNISENASRSSEIDG